MFYVPISSKGWRGFVTHILYYLLLRRRVHTLIQPDRTYHILLSITEYVHHQADFERRIVSAVILRLRANMSASFYE